MQGISQRLRTVFRMRLFGVPVPMIAAIVLMVGVLNKQGEPLTNSVAPQGMISLQLARDSAAAKKIIDEWDKAGWLKRAKWQVLLDFPFIVLYTPALFLFGLYARRRANAHGIPRLATAALFAAWAGLLAGVLDLIENAGLLAMLTGSQYSQYELLPPVTSLCAALKFTLIPASTIVSIAAALIADRPPNWDNLSQLSWGSMFGTIRPVVGVLLFTGLALLIPSQTADMLAILEDTGRGPRSGVAFHIALFLLAFAAWHWSRALLSARFGATDSGAGRNAVTRSGGKRAALEWGPRLMFAITVGIGVIAAWRSEAWVQFGLIAVWGIPGWLLMVYRLAIQQWLVDAGWLKRADLSGTRLWMNRLPLDAGTTALIGHAPLGPNLAVGLLGFALLAFLLALLTFFPELIEWATTSGFGALVAYGWGFVFPGPASVLLALALMLGPLSALTAASDRFQLAGHLLVPWTMRVPVFLFLLALVLVVPSLINLHAVRRVESAVIGVDDRKELIDNRATLETFFNDWVSRCGDGSATVRPVIVAISGGASPAGLWGARVLAKADAAARLGGTGIFAISSVSGGSLAPAAYLATLAAQNAAAAADAPSSNCTLSDANREQFNKTVVAAMGDDALGPLLAGALFGDIPRALLGIPAYLVRRVVYLVQGKPFEDWSGGDRAEALETGFERIWEDANTNGLEPGRLAPIPFDKPFLSIFYNAKETRRDKDGKEAPVLRPVPVWIANGAEAHSGVRVLTVPFKPEVDTFRGARDVLQLLKGDVRISTAIHNTARFPFLSPAGKLSPSDNQVIDGGYFENEGLLTAWELARYLKTREGKKLPNGRSIEKVEPILIQATFNTDKDVVESSVIRCKSHANPVASATLTALEPRTPSRLPEFLVPVIGVTAARGALSDWVMRNVKAEYCAAHPENDSFFHFYLYQVGKHPIPLNWTMSRQISDQIWAAMSEQRYKDKNTKEPNPNHCEAKMLTERLAPKKAALSGGAPPRDVCSQP